MKKSLVLGILGLAAAAVTSYGQGYITLDNYTHWDRPGWSFTGPEFPQTVSSERTLGTLGVGLNGSWTVGLYWAPARLASAEAAGIGDPDWYIGPWNREWFHN